MKHLKIVEQIIIVLVVAVLIPFATIGFIISNVSQHSIRYELESSATLLAQFLGDAIEHYIDYSQSELEQIASGFKYMPDASYKIHYFNEIESRTRLFKGLEVVDNAPQKPDYTVENSRITLYAPINEQNFLKGQINVDILGVLLNDKNIRDRYIYIFDAKTNSLIATNTKNLAQDNILEGLPNIILSKSFIFGDKKNTPKAYYRLNSPDWFIVVATTKEITADTITEARSKIIFSLVVAALSIIIIVFLYTSYLYINIRQLFKAIKAISKGNYDKKIRLIKRSFTPFELVFLSKEFNHMANKIKVSYRDLKKKNIELQKLNEFREDLINSTSHEFRTPLTSIIGYTSRLLRHDIALDDETRTKSLQIIKEQAQRLSRMVEDLLVIPELDSDSLKYNIDETDLGACVLRVVEYLKNERVELIPTIAPDLAHIWADEYRLEQIFLNLIDNAIKYSKDNAPIDITAQNIEGVPVVQIKNRCDKIDDEIKKKLFEKFIRADSKLTRTTRGTGLGLYIVRGLCEDMKIEISFEVDNYFTMTLKFRDYVK